MANQGILAQLKPAANTNTVLYSAPIDSSASAVLTVANDGTGSAYKVGLKDYDQKLVLDASTYLLHKGDAISDYRFTVNTAISASNTAFAPSTKITSDDKESTLIFESFYTPPTTTIYIKKFVARIITLESITGTFAVGATGDSANSDFDYITVGDSNVFSWTQGAAATATGGNQDFTITGTSNEYTGTCEVVGCINAWTISGNSNDITTTQTGSADHQITASLTGNSNTVTIDQTDTTSTNVVNLISTTTNGTIDVDQCASGC